MNKSTYIDSDGRLEKQCYRDRGMVVSTTNWHLPTTPTRIKSCAAAAADFQHPLKGVQGGEQK